MKSEVGCQLELGYYRIQILSLFGNVSRDNLGTGGWGNAGASETRKIKPGNQEKHSEARAVRAQQPPAGR